MAVGPTPPVQEEPPQADDNVATVPNPPGLVGLQSEDKKVDPSPEQPNREPAGIDWSKKQAFMHACQGLSTKLYHQLDQEYDVVHGCTEEWDQDRDEVPGSTEEESSGDLAQTGRGSAHVDTRSMGS